MYPWTRKFPLCFGSNPDPEHFLLGGRMRSLTAFVGTAFCMILHADKYNFTIWISTVS